MTTNGTTRPSTASRLMAVRPETLLTARWFFWHPARPMTEANVFDHLRALAAPRSLRAAAEPEPDPDRLAILARMDLARIVVFGWKQPIQEPPYPKPL